MDQKEDWKNIYEETEASKPKKKLIFITIIIIALFFGGIWIYQVQISKEIPTTTIPTQEPTTIPTTTPKLPEIQTKGTNIKVFAKLSSPNLILEEKSLPLLEQKTNKVNIAFFEMEDETKSDFELNEKLAEDSFNKIKSFYAKQSNNNLEFTTYRLLTKCLKQSITQDTIQQKLDECLESKKQELKDLNNTVVIAIVDKRNEFIQSDRPAAAYNNYVIIHRKFVNDNFILFHEIGHTDLVIGATDWYSPTTIDSYNQRPFNGLVDYDLFGNLPWGPSCYTDSSCFTIANKVVLLRLGYENIIAKNLPYETTITLKTNERLNKEDKVYRIPLEFVVNGGYSYLRSYVFDFRSVIDGGKGVYIQEIVEKLKTGFENIYAKPSWSVIVSRKIIDESTIPSYLSLKDQSIDGRITEFNDEFVNIKLLDERWNNNDLEQATLKINIKKQNIGPSYNSNAYITEKDDVLIAYVDGDTKINPIIFDTDGRISYLSSEITNNVIWIFVPIDSSVNDIETAKNSVETKFSKIYNGNAEDLIKYINAEFGTNLNPSKNKPEGDMTASVITEYVYIKNNLETPTIAFAFFNPVNNNFNGIFIKNALPKSYS